MNCQKQEKKHLLIKHYLEKTKKPSYMALVCIIMNKRKSTNTKKKQIK